jgi:hypothetical protein
VGGEIFRTCPDRSERDADPSPSSSAVVKKVYSYTSTPPMVLTACKDPQCLYKGALYLYLYLYSPYDPYGLYRAPVPVQGCTLPLPLPLLPVWTVRPVQSLSACTVELYLYSPYGPYGLYRASVPVQYSYTSTTPLGRTACTDSQCLYSTAIPLLPLWTVRPVQSLSACTRVHFTFTFAFFAIVV